MSSPAAAKSVSLDRSRRGWLALLLLRRRWLAVLWLATLVSLSIPRTGGTQAAESSPNVTFERHIQPILKAHCFHCHGEQAELAGGLDLRLRKQIIAGGDSGPAVQPGAPADSLLYQYVRSGEMPPKEELRLSDDELALISRWIDAGAPTEAVEPERVPEPGELLVTDAERAHWAFQLVVRPEVPGLPPNPQAPASADRTDRQLADRQLADRHPANRHPVDSFIARRLAEAGLEFSPPADRPTLIRRATLDLLGLPPTPEQVERFVADEAPDAYERLVDRLLASPHYGERWGRHWLDVVGYADSEGYDDKDLVRPDAWSYRDYVVRSLNADKPWDRFLVEQLAGDELAGATHATAELLANADPAARELLTATGFLRMAPDGSGSSPMDPALARHQVLSQTIQVLSSSLLGLTVGCAECHHHRYDPIPQQDYYRLRALLEPVFDPGNWRMPNARRAALLSPAARVRAEAITAEVRRLDERHDALKQEVVEQVLGRVLETVPEPERAAARQAFQTEAARRTPEQQQLVQEKYPMLGLLRPGALHLFLARFQDGEQLKEGYEKIKAEADALRATIPQPDLIRVATEDPRHLPETFVFHRGDFHSPTGGPIQPGGLTVLGGQQPAVFASDEPGRETTGRRLAFARHLTSGRHPLLARVLVNRFWMHHFGQGLVDTPGDFGLRGSPPSHPQLLDWLASEFVDGGWQLKRLHRLIMTSRVYRQSSLRRPEAESVDAENRLLWRMPVRRLESETVRDSILAVSGQLHRSLSGPPVPVALNDAGIITVQGAGTQPDAFRRSLYIQVRRTQPVAMLEAFDSPQMEPNCERRVSSTVATQALALMNGDFVLHQASALADRVLRETGSESTPAQRVERAWTLAHGRSPSDAERTALTAFLAEQQTEFARRNVNDPGRQALASLCQVLLGTNRFLYVD